jgi:hypothetical protein
MQPRQLLRTIRVTNNGWPVEIILVKRGAYLDITTALGGDGAPRYQKPHTASKSFQTAKNRCSTIDAPHHEPGE